MLAREEGDASYGEGQCREKEQRDDEREVALARCALEQLVDGEIESRDAEQDEPEKLELPTVGGDALGDLRLLIRNELLEFDIEYIGE